MRFWRTSGTTRASRLAGVHSGLSVHSGVSFDLRRVVVVGSSCSGKTSLARRIADQLGATHIELDAIHWLPNWKERPTEEFREHTRAAVGTDKWVVDGNYSKVRDIVWPKATTVIWLNYPFPLVFYRVLRRTIARSVRGQILFSGNKETLKKAFLSRDSILWWVITTFRRRNRQYRTIFANNEFPHLDVIEFQKPRQADEFLFNLQHPSEAA